MNQPKPPIERVQVAATLRRMREEADATRQEIADLLSCTISKIGDLETGRAKPKPLELRVLLDHYGVPPEDRAELEEYAEAARVRGRRGRDVIATIPANRRRSRDLEAQAVTSIYYSGELIPGILQVEPYARALLGYGEANPPDLVEKLLLMRMERKKELVRADRPPLRFWCILGEAALRSGIGGPDTMRAQLAHLIEMNTTLSTVVIQVLPLGSGPHAFVGASVRHHRFPPPAPDMLDTDITTRNVISDDEDEVANAEHFFDLLRTQALGKEESTALIRRVLDEQEAS